jgi:polyisoprenyl-phosphate glycosyltransferase
VVEPMLSAVIACYKDARAIPVMYERLTAVFGSLGVRYEIIFVNDGSPDDSDSVLSALTAKDDHVLAIEHSRNFGSQNAFISGMQLAAGDAVILLDGDLQDPPELIAAFYTKWREGSDVVYGRRVQRAGQPWLAFFAMAFYRVFRGISQVPMPLDAGDFALMDRKVVNALLALPETDQFLRGLRAWIGFTQTGVDYIRPERPFGRSTHSWLKNVWWAKKGIFSFSFVPVEVIGYAAAVMTLAATCALIYQGIEAVRHPEVPYGVSLVVTLVAFFGSLNLLAVALVGEYLIKVVEEVKRRPKFIRRAIRHGQERLMNATEIDQFLRARRADTRALRPQNSHAASGHET